MDPTSSTNSNTHLLVSHATVVQTECEANMLRVVRGLINRSVGACVQGFDMRRIQLLSLSSTLSVDFNFGGKQVFISLK